MICSPTIQKYFESLEKEVKMLYTIAQQARAKNLDPESVVDIPLAASVAQRVEALISSIAPALYDKGLAARIIELEKKYEPGDWRIALIIAEEVAKEKFCKFKDIREAIEVGIRTGFAYITMGVTAAPLEGLVEVKLKKRLDGKDYLALYYAGPIRSAGGTAAAVSVVIADYVRRKLGILDYDITNEEVKRYQVEIDDYVTKIAHRQYVPTAEEIEMLVRNVKVEITGDPTERYEVSQCKRLPRVETDAIRGGTALILTEGPSLKASKLWKKMKQWKDEFGLESWNWLRDFIALKESIHSATTKEDTKVKPVDSYLRDMVAGRPVFGYPMVSGGFRLRYGRSRLSGFAATAVHPATMQALNDYLATGTQIKVERPGKATVVAPCDTIEGPIVRLEDGSVLKLSDEVKTKELRRHIDEILFLGDLLVNYGDFSENGQRLVPVGYCEEWWNEEVKAAGKTPTHPKSAQDAIKVSEELNVPLHPNYTHFWKEIPAQEFELLIDWLKKIKGNTLPLDPEPKKVLELIGCPHTVKEGKVILDEDNLTILQYLLSSKDFKGQDGLECVNSISKIKIRDKSGTFIGTRMGRPEKAKLRKLKGSPQVLFPVGTEGGRLRSVQEAAGKSIVTADFPIYECESCRKITIYPSCENCGAKTTLWRICHICKKKTRKTRCHAETKAFERRRLDIKHYLQKAKERANIQQLPTLIKGVRGTWNKGHICENLIKGLLRAKYKLYVNKDGTIRYDMTEMGITHFKPTEIGTSISKLKELGYTQDVDGNPLENEEQILEIKPQDVILPSCPESTEDGADVVLMRVCNFVDDLLKNFYNLQPYYNVKGKEDLIGQLVVGLAPHTSCGVIARIIGFSQTQGCFAHPFWHAAQRRNLDGDETCIMLAMDAFLNFSRKFLPDRRGGRSMDAPLVLTTVLEPTEIDTEVHGLDVAKNYPLEFYQAALENKYPWDVKVEQVKHRLGKPEQYENFGYTHKVSNMNSGTRMSAYKSKPTMLEKLEGQIILARKIRAVNLEGVASLVIDRHFIRDIKGNLRKFTSQEFRCVKCNSKYRRPPLSGICTSCGGKLIFTIAEGTVKKYLDASIKLASIDGMPNYIRQTIELLKRRIESIFGKDSTKQIELKSFFN